MTQLKTLWLFRRTIRKMQNQWSSYVNHGFKIVSAAKSHFKINGEQNPVTDFNLFDLHGIGFDSSTKRDLYVGHRQHRTIYYCTSCCSINLAQLMAEGYASNQGVKIALNCCLKAPANIELKRHALNWTKEDNPKESDVVFRVARWVYSDVLPPSIHPDTGRLIFWVGDYKTYLNYRRIIKYLDTMGYC